MILRYIKKEDHIKMVPYTISIRSLYAMLYTRLNIYFAVGIISKYQLNLRSLNLVGVKHMIGKKRIDPLWQINLLINQVY